MDRAQPSPNGPRAQARADREGALARRSTAVAQGDRADQLAGDELDLGVADAQLGRPGPCRGARFGVTAAAPTVNVRQAASAATPPTPQRFDPIPTAPPI